MTADLLSRLKGTDATLAWVKTLSSDPRAARALPNLLNSIGYRLLLETQYADAIKVFETCVELYPENANAHDSLGEGYFKAGKKAEAIASYKKSLQLDPKNTNAVKMLEQLGATP